ncbi:MAG: glycosyltransferase family 4 protein, partial [Bacteroidota bacterium]
IKNIPLMLNAWAMLPPDFRARACLFLIGDGEDRMELEALCEHLGLLTWTPEKHTEHAEVYFTSWIREADKAMAGMDIIALSSLNEGTPASLIEAMAAGKPIVTTNVGGISDMVQQDVNALIVDSGNPTQLSSALQRIISDQDLRDRIARVGPQTAKDRYSERRLMEEMRALYRKLLKVNA